tara:strand:- start:115 stop:540 length:426 start_codon:yes stop_codon:yes gene_type:complete
MSDYFYLGIDYGTKKTGLAIGQMITNKTRPLKIVYDNYLDEIISIINEWSIRKIIIGFPVNNSKKDNKIQSEIKLFSNQLGSIIDPSIEIILYDESSSSDMAKETFKEMRMKGVRKKKDSNYDDISASIILQSWINENTME